MTEIYEFDFPVLNLSTNIVLRLYTKVKGRNYIIQTTTLPTSLYTPDTYLPRNTQNSRATSLAAWTLRVSALGALPTSATQPTTRRRRARYVNDQYFERLRFGRRLIGRPRGPHCLPGTRARGARAYRRNAPAAAPAGPALFTRGRVLSFAAPAAEKRRKPRGKKEARRVRARESVPRAGVPGG